MRYTISLWSLFLCLILAIPASGAVFEPRFAGQQTVDGENSVAVTFSSALDARQNLSDFLSLRNRKGKAMDGAWVLSSDPQVVYFPRVEADTPYRIEVLKGLKSREGDTLSATVTYDVTTRPAEPKITFGSRGFVLASRLTRGLPVDSMNIPRADIDFFRVRADKVADFKAGFWEKDYLYSYQNEGLKQVADLVYTGGWDLDIKKNLRTRVNIPITGIKELQKPGIYFAVLRGAGQYEYGYNTTWFTVSDLGVHARVYEGSIRFFVQSLETAEPLASARISGMDKKGKQLFSATTGDTGEAVVKGEFSRLTLVTVSRGAHTTLMPMDVPALDLSEFKTGSPPFRPVEFFAYGPRDIYRPGETVDIEGVIRDGDGRMTNGLPIKAQVLRPDGRMVREFTMTAGPQNHYSESFSLPANALTGKWKVSFTLGKTALEPYPFVVAEFLPERMKLSLDGGEKVILNPKANPSLDIQGDYLYGAPAAGVRSDARIRIKPARELFKDKWPGVEFGSTQYVLNTSFTTAEVHLDDKGHAVLPVKSQWQKITSPHWVTANVSLYDSGGRPVVRNWSWQVWPAKTLVGIRCLSAKDKDEPGEVDSRSVAEFEVMVADIAGNKVAAKGLEAVLIREHREYYWEYRNDSWHWGFTSNFYPVERMKLDVEAGKTVTLPVPVEWGGYRLEIINPATGLTTAYKFRAGWRYEDRGQGVMNRPDRVDLTLDKAAYSGGDVAHVTVKAPEGGTGYLFVDAGSNLVTLPVTVPPEGKVFEIKVDPEWQRHDIYVSALIIRPGESRTKALPKRAVGLIPLPLDREDRRLSIDIKGPAKSEPNRKITVPVTVTRADGSVPAHALVTLAAVDVGVLNLTEFKTPDPWGYFFQLRQYRTRLQDVYQKLIEAGDGEDGRQRYGGDAPTLNRGGDKPATDVRILSIQKAPVATDGSGKAVFTLDIPEFDGRVRLMAVAHTEDSFGRSDREMILASPLVVQADLPRFLATGDESMVVISLHNLTDTPQHLTLSPSITGTGQLREPADLTLDLDPAQKKVIRLPLTASNTPGRMTISCRIRGLLVSEDGAPAKEPRTLERSWFIETRPPYPAKTRIWSKVLEPGASFAVDQKALDNLVAGTVAVQAGLGSEPPINLGEHLSQLFAYPYGCLEQTVSGIFPHVLLTLEQIRDLGLATGSREETAKKIDRGIQRLLEKQNSQGGFGLWSSSGPEMAWLTAYAAHFFVLAQNAGFQIPESAVDKTLKRLQLYVRQPGQIPLRSYMDKNTYKAAVRAYSAFVLAQVQSLTLGDARSVAAYAEKYAKGSLAFVQAGGAAGLAGDEALAKKMFDLAIKTSRPGDIYIGDYGSDIRDFSMAYAVLATEFPDYKNRRLFLLEVDRLVKARRWHWFSTQERNALVMAGAARAKTAGQPWKADLTVGNGASSMSGTQSGQAVFVHGTAAKGFSVTNSGKTDLYVDVTLSGYPHKQPDPESLGVEIKRRFLDIRGNSLDFDRAVSGDRVIVELTMTRDWDRYLNNVMHNALVVDLLPACLELSDPNLSGAFIIDDIKVDGKLIREWQKGNQIAHQEFRDDRFAAALDLSGKRITRIFYGARVVTPGTFRVPAPMVEDMYQPYIRSIGSAPDRIVVTMP